MISFPLQLCSTANPSELAAIGRPGSPELEIDMLRWNMNKLSLKQVPTSGARSRKCGNYLDALWFGREYKCISLENFIRDILKDDGILGGSSHSGRRTLAT